jgi:hypothetical protein
VTAPAAWRAETTTLPHSLAPIRSRNFLRPDLHLITKPGAGQGYLRLFRGPVEHEWSILTIARSINRMARKRVPSEDPDAGSHRGRHHTIPMNFASKSSVVEGECGFPAPWCGAQHPLRPVLTRPWAIATDPPSYTDSPNPSAKSQSETLTSQRKGRFKPTQRAPFCLRPRQPVGAGRILSEV